MGTQDLADVVSQEAAEADVMLLENHGILTTGPSLLSAFDKIEVLENAAKISFIVEITGKKRALSTPRLREIEKMFR
jgi:L-fuculose-phosphate aldolase